MRRIVCQKCFEKYHNKGMHPEDEAMGFHKRVVKLRVKRPADHSFQIISDSEPTRTESLPSILCDDCGDAIPDGTEATAVSMWQRGMLGEWEHEYGEVIA